MMAVKIKRMLPVLFLLVFAVIAGIFRICKLNRQYPSPPEICFHTKEDCLVSNYRIRLLDMELLSGGDLRELVSGRPLLYHSDGTPYPWEKQRLALATVEIEGTTDQNVPLDLTGIALETKAWGNGLAGELFPMVNGEHSSLYAELEEGEKQTITLPFFMNEEQFAEKDWRDLDAEKFSLILSYYPEKIMLSK